MSILHNNPKLRFQGLNCALVYGACWHFSPMTGPLIEIGELILYKVQSGEGISADICFSEPSTVDTSCNVIIEMCYVQRN